MPRFRCISCGFVSHNYSERCPQCGFLTELVPDKLEWSLDEDEPTIWRYKNLLPPEKRRVSLGEGFTPLRRLEGILVKDETRNPTGSYVDRGSSVLASCSDLPERVELDFSQDVTTSLATYLLEAGVGVGVRVDPENVELTELLYLSSLEVTISFDGGTGKIYESPYMIEGFKTIAYELYEARDELEGVVVPAESGVLAYGIMKGFFELEEMSLMRVPPMYLAYHGDGRTKLLEILESRGARLVEVDAASALESLMHLAKRGLYVKPVAAKAYSLASRLGGDKVAILTGSGLRKWHEPEPDRPLTKLQVRILEILEKGGEMTAYQVWRLLGDASLQGVYKALSKLVETGMVKSRQIMSKKRKIRLYSAKGH